MSEKYQALYRKWRPLTFEDVAGQGHVSETLRNSIASGRIAHAYLFCGTRGTGKTSTAKIFSRAVNCEHTNDGNPCNECDTCKGIMDGSILDVYEMDAASNSGIDNIREIREEVVYAPTNSRFKVYIIDEAHMLTTEAFNALLKTLEEPPAHVIFILATTEAHKIPATILSRCQRFDFKRIGIDDIERRLSKIVRSEDIKITADALELVAELADGSMRDGLSILDQCVAYAKEELRYDDIVDIVGIADKRILFPIVDFIADYNAGGALSAVDDFLKKGKEAANFIEELVFHFRALMLCKSMDNPGELLEKSAELIEKYKQQSEKFGLDRIIYIIETLGEYLFQAKKLSTPKVAVEMATVSICSKGNAKDIDELLMRVESLEKELATIKENGVTVKKTAAKPNGAKPAENSLVKPAEVHIDEGKLWTKWRDALSAVKEESKSLYMYLFNAKALFYGDEIELVIASDLAFEKINTPEGRDYLGGLFSKIQGSELRVTVSGKEGPRQRNDQNASIFDIAAKKDLLGDKMTVVED
ncbi:MAG: DNA polymerase III subunit gamma/tau [Clostridia bacterium]|nr:DNA polymerase III subunit gamma/tau [Clostridia bacterium]